MSFELARRLVKSGALEARDVETALLSAVARRVAFVQALIDFGPNVGRAVLQELASLPDPAVHTVRIDSMLMRRLPAGMCERLLAAPLATESAGHVTVCAVDPLDAHVEQEFSFQLGSRVRVVRAAYAELVTALEVLQGGFGPARSAGTRTEPLDAGAGPPSVPPIPLVRKQAPRDAPRPKPSLEHSRARIVAATSPPELIESLRLALGLEAKRLLIFAVKEGVFEGLASLLEPAAEPAEDVRSLRAGVAEPSVLASALAAGYYLGRLKQSPLDRSIEAALDLRLGEEVYAVPVFVSGRAALVVVAAGLDGPLETTRRIDELARDAGAQLEQIVLRRKRR